MRYQSTNVRFIFAAAALSMAGGTMAKDGPGTLKAQFIYADEITTSRPALQKLCPQAGAQSVALATIATDVVVSLVGKTVESIIDAAAAKTQPEATTLDVTIPLDGFFDEKGDLAVSGGCLIFHNADESDLTDASMLGSFVLVPSYDKTAFRFQVFQWKFSSYLKPQTSRWFQQDGVRDFVLKIEFLSPGSAGLGTRSVYVEHAFTAVSVPSIAAAFSKGQDLPWFSAPPKPSGLPVNPPTGQPKTRYFPLNIRVTAIETTRANQFAQWVRDIAKEKKTDISAAVKDAVKKSLDESYAVTDKTKQADLASTAYAAYKAAWDDTAAHKVLKPKDPGTADQATKDKFAADTQAWRALLTVKLQGVAAKKVLARAAFSNAELDWPGDLPGIMAD